MTDRSRRKRKKDDGLHIDDWLMTYADMITLLLCFFAIFLSVSVPRKEKFEEARQDVLQKFAQPDVLKGKFPMPQTNATGGLPKSQFDQLPAIVGAAFPPPPPKQENPPPKKGDRITTVDMNSATFFPSGSATLSDDGKAVLVKVLASLNTSQYKDFVITVEGHTDDNPINTPQFPSNWELSTARAAAVVRFFIEQGIPVDKLRASGYADVKPKVPNRDTSGNPIPANQAQNRRVVIKLEKIDKEEDKE
jgi:chemotaxis protein MotB